MPVGRVCSTAARSRSATSGLARQADAGEHDQELLAAESVDELERAQPLAQLIGDVAQDRVAAVVAVLVVDVLEAVDVAQHQAHGLAGQPRLVGDLQEARQQRVAVEQAGEWVEDRLVAVMQLGRLQCPDDRDDPRQQREHGDHRHGVVECRGGCTPTSVASVIDTTVSTSAAITTWGRKRAATMPAGQHHPGSTGLRGPPLSAIPAPISSIVITIAMR